MKICNVYAVAVSHRKGAVLANGIAKHAVHMAKCRILCFLTKRMLAFEIQLIAYEVSSASVCVVQHSTHKFHFERYSTLDIL